MSQNSVINIGSKKKKKKKKKKIIFLLDKLFTNEMFFAVWKNLNANFQRRSLHREDIGY